MTNKIEVGDDVLLRDISITSTTEAWQDEKRPRMAMEVVEIGKMPKHPDIDGARCQWQGVSGSHYEAWFPVESLDRILIVRSDIVD